MLNQRACAFLFRLQVMKRKSGLLLGLAGVALAFALVYQFLGPRSRRQSMAIPNFDRFFESANDWQIEELPIANTPEMLRSVESLLRYDYASFRVYKRGNTEIAIYMAYWLPGKVHPQNIDAHTPDVCWVANGWQMELRPPLPPVRVSTRGGTQKVLLVNHRSFTTQNSTLDVLYWHIDGGHFRLNESVDEAALSKSEYWKRRLRKEWVTITAGAGSQLFVRVSTNEKLADLLDTEPLQGVFSIIADAMASAPDLHAQN